MNKIHLLLAMLGVVGVLAGCPKAVVLEGCASDIDCGAAQRCDSARGQCLCLDDNACDATEFCNIAGACQPQLECLNNGDCTSAELCDTNTGSCITKAPGVCVLDSQCPFGSFCAQNRACTPGCRDDGDCVLGTPCLEGTCDATPGACSGNSFCEFGQLCGTNNNCANHPDRSQLCSTCDPLLGSPCADDCLIDGSVQPTACTRDTDCETGTCEPARCRDSADCPNGGSCGFGSCSTSICQGFFCGASGCSENNPCPRGYECNSLQIVSGVQCTLGAPNTCGANRGCRGGGELGSVGFCSCASTEDCPVSFNFPDMECVNPGANGACVIGTTCGPADGLLCEDLR